MIQIKELRWIEYNPLIPATWPVSPGKYFVYRKDGKVHWETFNGSGWAYNRESIKYYAEIELPD